MHLLAPVLTMSHSISIRLVVVGASEDLVTRLDSRDTTVIAVPVTERVITAVVEARPSVVLLSKSIGARTAIWVCQALKERQALQQVPIIFYGHGDEPATEKAAFAAGADDYVPRVGPAAILRSRINAILRRYSANEYAQEEETKPSLRIGDIEVQFESYLANVAGRIVPLTVGEFRVLWKLAKNPGKTLSATELSPTYMEIDGPSPDRSVRSHVWSLRRKLGRRAGSQIQTVRNAGYRLTEE